MNECSEYCEDCNEGFCEHCEPLEEIDEKYYCDNRAERKKKEGGTKEG